MFCSSFLKFSVRACRKFLRIFCGVRLKTKMRLVLQQTRCHSMFQEWFWPQKSKSSPRPKNVIPEQCMPASDKTSSQDSDESNESSSESGQQIKTEPNRNRKSGKKRRSQLVSRKKKNRKNSSPKNKRNLYWLKTKRKDKSPVVEKQKVPVFAESQTQRSVVSEKTEAEDTCSSGWTARKDPRNTGRTIQEIRRSTKSHWRVSILEQPLRLVAAPKKVAKRRKIKQYASWSKPYTLGLQQH